MSRALALSARPYLFVYLVSSLACLFGCEDPAPPTPSLTFEFSSCLGSVSAEDSCSAQLLSQLPQDEIGCWVLRAPDDRVEYRSRMQWDGGTFTPSAQVSVDDFPFSIGDAVKMTLIIFDTADASLLCDTLDPDMRCGDLAGCRARISRSEVTLTADEEISFRDEFGSCRNDVPSVASAAEVTDGLDNDCDGQVDEELIMGCLNGDTIPCESECGVGVKQCIQGEFGECEPLSTPPEVCGDMIDNNCNGRVDEGCECIPEPERCDDMIDNDCDGQVNEDCECIPEPERCDDMIDNDCDGQVNEDCECVPGPELCDGLDNNCNGQVDEDLTAPLADEQAGVCSGAEQRCDGERGWVEPDYTQLEDYQPEEGADDCGDHLDNDCDGDVDEGCVCVPTGDEVCDGRDNDCNDEVDEGCVCDIGDEFCDGVDNDCDDDVDEELTPMPASRQAGVCAGSFQVCRGSQGWGDPDYAQMFPDYERDETRCDGLDNDCDGNIDEALGAFAPDARLSVGVCANQVKRCEGGAWVEPDYDDVPNYEQSETTCDGLDNDCDGAPDESLQAFAPEASLSQGVCDGLMKTCQNGMWTDPNYNATPGYEADEVSCDGLDNDCDGDPDESLEAVAPDALKTLGVCAGQRQSCEGGAWVEPNYDEIDGYEQSETSCDGLDNNCNGLIDELCPADCVPSPTGEICNGRDDDCDGLLDEDNVCAQLIYDHCRFSLSWAEINGNVAPSPWLQAPPNGSDTCEVGDNFDTGTSSCDTASAGEGFRAIEIGRDNIGRADWLAIAWECDLSAEGLEVDELVVLTWANQDCHVALGYQDLGNAAGFAGVPPSSCGSFSPYPDGEENPGGRARCVSTAQPGQYSAIELEGRVNHDDWFGIGFYCDADEVAPIDPTRAWFQIVSKIQQGFVVYFATYQGDNERQDGANRWSSDLPSQLIDNSSSSRGAGSPINGFSVFKLRDDAILRDDNLISGNQLGISIRLSDR